MVITPNNIGARQPDIVFCIGFVTAQKDAIGVLVENHVRDGIQHGLQKALICLALTIQP